MNSPPPAAGAPLIALRGIRKHYGGGDTGQPAVTVLHGIDLDIHAGEFVAVVGSSGSGKSTLMNILGCLDILTTGTYQLGGQNVADLDEDELAEIRNHYIGFVFQQFNLLPALSAWRNVELPLVYAGMPAAERKERAIEALGRVGLEGRMGHRPGELSGGQQQRVAVARALASDPAMILADEPTGNLDSRSTADVLLLLDELHASGRTIVLITHEADVAARADRVLHVRDGRIMDADLAGVLR